MRSARWLCVALLAGHSCLPSGASAAEADSFVVSDIVVDGANPLSARETMALLRPFLGVHRDIDGLRPAAQALEDALHAAGWGLHRVVLPPQQVEHSITLKVVAPRVSEVAVRGRKQVSEANVRRSLPAVQPGSTLNLRELSRQIGLANESMARNESVTLRKADATDGIAVEVDVTDRSPWSLNVMADNSGTADPARSRLSVAVQHANLFDRDQAVTLSYTTSPEAWSSVRQFGLFYTAPLYGLASSISVYGFHSSVDSGVVGDYFDVSGSGDFVGASVKHQLRPWAAWNPSVRVAVDDKHFKDGTAFAGIPIGSEVRSRSATVEVAARREAAWGQLRAHAEYVRNLGGGSHNDDAAYSAVRVGADRAWQLWRAGLSLRRDLPRGATLSGRVSGQWAAEPMIPGEQFGLGGDDSVRGLETRQALGDGGVQASVELYSGPVMHTMQVGLFYDVGRVARRQAVPGIASHEGVQSVGAGVRWQPGLDAFVSVTYGRLLDAIAGSSAGDSRVNATISVRL